MNQKKINNIAIFTPHENPYSETFIQAHKKYLTGNIFYYYGLGPQIKINDKLVTSSTIKKTFYKLFSKLTGRNYNFFWRKLLISHVKNQKIDLVLVEYGTHAFHLKEVLKNLNIPIITHFHGLDASVYNIIKSCNNYKEVFNLSNKIITVSNVMYKTLLDLGCPKHKLMYNVYGPQSEFESIRPNYSKPQFVSVGRFTDKKAPYYLVFAMLKVVKKHPNYKLLIAGDGVLFNTVKNLINYLKLDNNIELLGIIKPEEYRNLLQESMAYVQHSITALNGDMEGTPLSILEAGIAGLPVISTKHAGIQDVIIHEKTGFLVNEHDVDKMAEYMLRLIEDREEIKRMGIASKINISKNFNINQHINKLNSLIEELTMQK
jgi:colanic acid/amylovoran biosynthesis glycosyltransferase